MKFPAKRAKPRLGASRGGLAKIGNMRDLQRALWEVIDKLRGEIKAKNELIDTLPLKACHTFATLAGVYVRLHEVADLAPRMELLEKALADQTGIQTRPRGDYSKAALGVDDYESPGGTD